MKKLKQGKSLMPFKKFKTFAMCDIILTVLFCIYSLSLFFKMTNTNVLLTVIIYVPFLFIYPLLICPILTNHLLNNFTIEKKEKFIFTGIIFLSSLIMFCLPVIPQFHKYKIYQSLLLILLPAILSSISFFLGDFIKRKLNGLHKLLIFFVYAFMVVLLLLPSIFYNKLENNDFLLLFSIFIHFPILILSPMVANPILGHIIGNQYTFDFREKLKSSMIVFLIWFFVFSIALQPLLFSRNLWSGYLLNFFLLVLIPDLMSTITFSIALFIRTRNR